MSEMQHYSRERDARRAERNRVQKVGSFDVVRAEDPVVVEGNPEWSEPTKRLWLVATQSEVARWRWSSTDWVVLYDLCDWWENLSPTKRGAHAYAVRAQMFSELGLTDAGRRKGLGLVVDHADEEAWMTEEEQAAYDAAMSGDDE